MNRNSVPPIVAILVGIDEYNNYPSLKSAVGDAEKLRDFLSSEFPGSIITILTDSKATRQGIINTLASLQNTPHRGNAILFFFSGYAGKAPLEREPTQMNSEVGMICPVDMGKDVPGIPDQTLIGWFSNIAKVRGNNITVFLDCPSSTFSWGKPSSFVVVAPKIATETKEGGAFTNSLIKVLRAEKNSIMSLTVQSLVDKMQTDMNADIHCYGENIDGVLFNPAAGSAYHTFISGKVLEDGSFVLNAGDAHGVRAGATYGIYLSNVLPNPVPFRFVQASRFDWNTICGHLQVISVKNDTSAMLHTPDFYIPNIFYAVETRVPGETVNIFFRDLSSSDIAKIKRFPNCKQVKTFKDANITLKFAEGKVGLSWNGVVNDHQSMRETEPDNNFDFSMDRDEFIARIVRNAARFTYHLSRSPAYDSPFLKGLEVQLQKVDPSKGDGNSTNLLNDRLFFELALEPGETYGPYCTVLYNNSDVPVWPFIFICDPNRFTILPWYMPHPSIMEAPLQPGERFIVGCGNESNLLFKWQEKRQTAISYIKVFVTTERTKFSSLIQQFRSSAEDHYRELTRQSSYSTERFEATSDGSDGSDSDDNQQFYDVDEGSPSAKLLGKPSWTEVRITIKQTYK